MSFWEHSHLVWSRYHGGHPRILPSGHWHFPPYRVCVIFVDFRSLVAQMVKNPPAVQETQVQSLGREDTLEKEMATHSSILVSRILWTEEPGRLQSMGSQRVRHGWETKCSAVLMYWHMFKFKVRRAESQLSAEVRLLRPGFLKFSPVDALAWIVFLKLWGAVNTHGQTLSSFPGLYPLDASSTPSPTVTIKNETGHCQMFTWEGGIPV